MAERKRNARQSREQWTRRVRAWGRSGLSAPEFCRRRGLKCSTLRWWAWRLGPEASRAGSAGLIRVEVEGARDVRGAAANAEPFEVALPGGAVVRVAASFDASALGRLLDCLAERGRC